jgi:hypothetical protein
MSARIRFRLGTLLWIVALLAVSLGWWIDRQQLEARHRKAQSLLNHKLLLEMRDHAIERDKLLEQVHRLSKIAPKQSRSPALD